MTSSPFDDEFWRRQDELLGMVPPPPTSLPPTSVPPTSVPPAAEVTHRMPIVSGPTPPPPTDGPRPSTDADLAALEAEVRDATQRAAAAERRAEERDAALRAVIETFETQLADMEAEHVRRLETIRIGAESEAKRIMADGRRRADSLLAGVRPSYEQGLGDVG